MRAVVAMRLFNVLLVVMLCVSCTGSGPSKEPSLTPVAATPQSVALTADGVPGKVRIGVVVTLSSAPGEGADWALAAEGVEVAAERFRSGGHDVEVVVVDDRGSAEGSAAAVVELASQDVAGIVLATSGSHAKEAITEARAQHIAIVAPYLTQDDYLAEGMWATGLLRSTHDASFQEALLALEAGRAIQVTAAGAVVPKGFTPQAEIAFDPATKDNSQFIQELAEAAAEGADVIVILGDADSSAQATAAVRGTALGLPVLLTNSATSPAFSAGLLRDTGSLSGAYWTVGLANDDPAASRQDSTGRSMTAFLKAVQRTAQNPMVTRYLDTAPFSEVAHAADASSHDAAVALMLAVARAGSAEPQKVLSVMPQLSLTQDQGLVGPPLDFSRPAALADGSVVPLAATTDYSAGRPGQGPKLRWFEAARGS